MNLKAFLCSVEKNTPAWGDCSGLHNLKPVLDSYQSGCGWGGLCCVTTRNNEFLPHVTYIKNLLNNPAVVSLQCLLIGFCDINPNEVGVVLISVPVCQTLEQNLDETETPAGETEYIKAFISLDESWTDSMTQLSSGGPYLFSHIRANVAPILGHSAPWASRSATTMSSRVVYFAGLVTYTALIFWKCTFEFSLHVGAEPL